MAREESNVVNRPCLFCGNKDQRKTDEHVIQKGFHTSMVLRNTVCTQCNTDRFSPLDKALVDVIHTWFCSGHPDNPKPQMLFQDGHTVVLIKKYGVWSSARFTANGIPIPFPQIVMIDEGKYFVGTEAAGKAERDVIVEKMISELSFPERVEISLAVLPLASKETNPPLQPAILRSSPWKYAVRATTRTRAEEVRSSILNGDFMKGFLSTKPFTHEVYREDNNVPIKHAVFKDGEIRRALAKSAVNILCRMEGYKRASSSEFSAIKDFILHGTHYEDQRYVELFMSPTTVTDGFANIAKRIAKPECHTVLLEYRNDVPVVQFIFYQRPIGTVHLKDRRGSASSTALPAGILFNYKTKKHRVLDAATLCRIKSFDEEL